MHVLTCTHTHLWQNFFRDPSKLKTLEPPLFASNKLVLLRDMIFFISVAEKKTLLETFSHKSPFVKRT